MSESVDKFEQNIFVIESPSPTDIYEQRREGDALMHSLTLAEINCNYYSVANKVILERCLKEIDALDPSTTRFLAVQQYDAVSIHTLGRTVNLRTLHFSAHGNDDGLELTSGDFIAWTALGNMLYDMRTMKEVPPGSPGLLLVTMSTCCGLRGRRMKRPNCLAPFMALVGPDKPVAWSDSLTAWVTFFHLLVKHKLVPKEAVAIMNKAAGLDDTFHCLDWSEA